MKLVIYLILLFDIRNYMTQTLVSKYVSLINEDINRAFHSDLPQNSSTYKPTSGDESVYGIFDYVIVGAGSAGNVIADRLSENIKNQVLLIEAGGHETTFSNIPLMSFYLSGLRFNWNYNTTPQTNACLGFLNKECAYPRGKAVGGSSAINSVVYARGNRRDYNDWYEQGNPGWSYKDVLPLFKKSETAHINGDPGYHGKHGPLYVEYPQLNYSPQFDAFIEANMELGRRVLDYNGRRQLGVARTQFNIVSGRRDSTGKAFYLPADKRHNLRLLTGCLVIKILITSVTRTACGVLFSCKENGEGTLIALARKEIIVSAGTFNSAQLLMLSGIGPLNHLSELGIPVVKSLAVGRNLQEHPTFYGLNFVTNYTEPANNLEEYVKEYLRHYGPLTIPKNLQGIGFFQSKLETRQGYPDIELIMVPSNNSNSYLQRYYHFTDETYNSIWGNVDPTRTFSIWAIKLNPKSRGYVELKSKDPYDFPIINPRFLSDPEGIDIESLYEGIRLALEIVNTTAFKRLNATLMYTPLPICQHYGYLSKDFWYCQLRQITTHTHHPVGTCKMGPNPLKGAVVDARLKVHGIRHLRVADASIMPTTIAGHTNAVAIMIGEKAAELIKQEHYSHRFLI